MQETACMRETWCTVVGGLLTDLDDITNNRRPAGRKETLRECDCVSHRSGQFNSAALSLLPAALFVPLPCAIHQVKARWLPVRTPLFLSPCCFISFVRHCNLIAFLISDFRSRQMNGKFYAKSCPFHSFATVTIRYGIISMPFEKAQICTMKCRN